MKKCSFLIVGALACIASAQAIAWDSVPKALEGIGIDQRLNEQIPAGLPFVDETGKSVRLSDYLGKKPAVLILAYYECPRLCTMVLNAAADAFSKADLEMGKDYQVITVSINPKEGPQLAAAKKAAYLTKLGHGDGGGWHFLTGTQDSITKLSVAVGFHYRYDPKEDQFLHASGIMVLTPQGKLSHYFYGITYPFRDLRLALVEASQGKIGSMADKILIFCCSVDLTTGRYTASIFRVVQLVGIVLTLTVAGLIYTLHRYEPKRTA